MTEEQIEQLAGKYLNDIVKPRNSDTWMDYVNDSWMYSAITWFCNEYEIATGFACPQDKIDIFKLYLYTEANKACDRKYGIRDGRYVLNSVHQDLQRLQNSLSFAIERFENGENPNNEYLPIDEINGAIALLKEAEKKLSKFVE